MAKINDTTTYPNTTPALGDHVPGTDVSNTGNDANGETVTFTLQALLDLFEANGAAPASFLASGTLADARVAQSNVTQHQAALSITESQISDLGSYLTTVAINDVSDITITTPADNEVLAYNGAGAWINQTAAEAGLATAAQGTLADSALQDVVDDTTPQLGGNLDVNGNSIVSASNGDITIAPNGTGNVVLGNYTLDADATVGAGQDGYVLKYTHSNGTWAPAVDSGAGGGISNVVEDTTPELGGNLSLADFGVTQNFTNANSSAITKGQPVYVTSGGTVDLADADAASTTTTTIGLVADASIDGTSPGPAGTGAICTFGVVDGFNTENLTAGSLVYVATGAAGALTTTQPTSGQIKPIGICLESHATTGRVFVCTSGFSAVPLADGASLKDTSGNEVLEFGVTASAVNHIKATNQATGSHPSLAAVGGDTNINLDLTPKGSGVVRAGGVEVVTLTGNQALTNKTLTAPVLGGTITGTYTLGGTPTLDLSGITSAGDLAVADGGTGSSTAAGARTNLGAAALGANVFTGTQDFNAQQVEGFANKVVTSVTGTLTMADHSGNILKTSGNITVPTTAGFNAVIIAGGAHTVSFNSTTSAAMATGDVMTVVVESGTVIHAVLTAAADKVSFT